MICLFIPTGETTRLNLFQSITSALDISLGKDPTAGTVIKKAVNYNVMTR
jgi:hypothetical protein